MKNVASFVVQLSALAISGCGIGRVHSGPALDAYRSNKATIAVVSLYVNDYKPLVDHLNPSGGDVDDIMEPLLDEMLSMAEVKLSEHFQVKAARGFVAQEGYRRLSSHTSFDVLRPRLEGNTMPIFSDSEEDLVRSQMTPERARELCSSLGVDMVAVVYSEWRTKTGGLIRTTKPLAGTVLSIYDESGELLYRNRKEGSGRTVGGFSAFDIDRTFVEWMKIYDKTLQSLVNRI